MLESLNTNTKADILGGMSTDLERHSQGGCLQARLVADALILLSHIPASIAVPRRLLPASGPQSEGR